LNTVPLVVDLDGTLLHSDLLLETGMSFVRNNPISCLRPVNWLRKGKAHLKEQLAISTSVDVSTLPYNETVVEFLKKQREAGRVLILATASHSTLAERVASHFGIFDHVHSSDGDVNLTAKHKRDLLVERYGQGGYDYMGNSHDDICVWESARYAYVVNPDSGVERKAMRSGNVLEVMQTPKATTRAWIKAFRLHQWMKNTLIFVPLLAAHQVTNLSLFIDGIVAFVLFGICASSVYILNDLLDLADDRHHKTKRNRPFASGKLSIASGVLVFPLLLVIAFAGALTILPEEFSIALGTYYLLTLAYSLSLKRMMGVDVIALALLYTMRIIAGAYAFQLVLTFWVLAFSMFIFLSLALVKRYAELREARVKGLKGKTRGRGYFPGDLEMIASLGAASGYLAVMVLALYLHDTVTMAMYAHPQVIWLACPALLFWITRVWILTHRGEMHDDPVIFAIRDRTSLMTGLVFCLIFWLAA
jgi:4-hydroxybenzoate polyprenyltransferase